MTELIANCVHFSQVEFSHCHLTILALVSSFYFSFFPVFLGLHLRHMEIPRREVESELHHSQGNSGSEPRLRPTPQLMATLDP